MEPPKPASITPYDPGLYVRALVNLVRPLHPSAPLRWGAKVPILPNSLLSETEVPLLSEILWRKISSLSETLPHLQGSRFYRFVVADLEELEGFAHRASSLGSVQYVHTLLEQRALRMALAVHHAIELNGISSPLNVDLAYAEYFRPQLEKAARTRRNIGLALGAVILFGLGVLAGHLSTEP